MSVRVLVSAALFLLSATGVFGFSVTTKNKEVEVKENEGIDLTCSHSADFGSNPRVEWKFKNRMGSQVYVVFDGKPTDPYSSRLSMYSGSNVRFSKVTRKDTGVYDCEVSGNSQFGEVRVTLTVLVPPSPPVCKIPSSVTTGKTAMLSCHDGDGSPPPTYTWYKNGVPLPAEPRTISGYQNATYSLNTTHGSLTYARTSRSDSGEYYCEAANKAGPVQRCRAARMEVRDINTGGIVAGVIVALLLLALLGFGIWYAHKKGYLPKKTESKPRPNVVYQPPSLYGDEEADGDFKQKSSFVV
ncbi:F11 receptor, tandem duplicate 1 [Takifugu rubripes]|uniref:F11 receptor, tandem duplicate 1 n=1 Tax=Takifugu rubripes TaxID=31033 RepID=UPI0002990E8F|nr:junctional adhesion molecule A [Takifugu rubripes]|eukprot:XP_003971293.1 PREDICTED: junctional adhesion molecule A [Takifugu rubripes]